MSLLTLISNNAHWLLRISIVSVFLYHGILKFMDLQGFSDMLPISYNMVFIVALAQVVGSLLLLLGGFGKQRLFDVATRVGAFLNIPVMVGAITMVHWGRWDFVPTDTHPLGGMEFQVVLALVMVYLVIVGNNQRSQTTTQPVANI